VTRAGDLWLLGRHRLLCGDSREPQTFDRLLGDERADLIFTDPSYNVPIDRNVCGLGRIRHREFTMGAGEMSSEAFTAFLQGTLRHAAASCRDGAIAFVCMDWRHMGELLASGRTVFSELKNLCVWNKTNGGTSRVGGKVRHEHIASLGSIETPLSIANRVAFWQRVHERLAKLSNRIDPATQGKIRGDIHSRIPMVTLMSSAACSLRTPKPTNDFGQTFKT
jgi:DNA modification methylase